VHDEEDPDLWIFDIARGVRTRLTFGKGREEFPIWTPSGEAILYHVRPEGSSALADLRVMRVAADGTGKPDTLAVGATPTVSPDGRYVVYSKVLRSGEWDLAFRPAEGDRSQEASLLSAPGWQFDARVAPGGEYVAYVSDESGEEEIYLTRFPSGQGRWQLSAGGGQWPRWNRRGDRLYYAKGEDIVAVEVSLEASPSIGTQRVVCSRPPIGVPVIAGYAAGFDVSDDEERLVFFRDPKESSAKHEVVVVQSWFAEFEGRK
jgi:Tol biopolymer transport system component